MITVRDIDSTVHKLPDTTVPQLRVLRRSFSRDLKSAPPRDVLRLAIGLAKRRDFTSRFFAYELVQHHPAALAAVDERTVVALGANPDDWAAVDTFACYIAGPAWRERQISDTIVRKWAASKDLWWRRTALVCTVPLNLQARGGTGDTPRTLDICERLVGDREDMVVKALSWALRVLSMRDPAAVRAFVAAHRSALAPRVLREVGHKLATGLKNPKRPKRA